MKKLIYIVPSLLFFAAACSEDPVEPQGQGDGSNLELSVSTLSFLIANMGLDAIISWSRPVLLFLYPLAVTLILLVLFCRLFGNDSSVYRWVTAFTAAAAAVDFVNALPGPVLSALYLEKPAGMLRDFLPFAEKGFGWLCPAILGLAAGIFFRMYKKSVYKKNSE